MYQIPTVIELLEAGAHFGHRTGRWNPKMAPFIFGERKGVHIINIEETRKYLVDALKFIEELVGNGGVLVFVGTKPQAKSIVEKYGKESEMPYISERWLGGTLTNFSQIFQVIKKYKTLKERFEKGEMKRYTKKEQSLFQKELAKLEKFVGGLSTLTKLPDALYVVDAHWDDTAVKEANRKGVPIIALCDTNVNPDHITRPIPANDDATKTIELITSMVSAAVRTGKELGKKKSNE